VAFDVKLVDVHDEPDSGACHFGGNNIY